MSDFETFEAPNFLLQKGGVLPVARLAYATRGTLNGARDNAVLVPSWYTGTHDDSEIFMLGEAGHRSEQILHHPDRSSRQRPVVVAEQQSGARGARPLSEWRSTTTSACSTC